MKRKALISGIAFMLASAVSFTAFAGEVKVTDMSDAVEYQYEETANEEIEQTAYFAEMSDGFQLYADESTKKQITVEYHTQSEIRNYIKNSGATLNDPLGFAQNPVTTSPYSAGRLSDATLNSALEMVKQIRYIAGLSDDIVLDEEMTNKAQAGMLLNYVNRNLSHYPKKPDDMDNELYELGYSGASRSNIAWASWQNRDINSTIVFSWMNDGDSSNINRLGHRRWILNPSMKKTGFGAVSGPNGTYSAVYALDRSNVSARQQGVVWPAQNMPVEYFRVNFPWSFSSGNNENIDNINVVLTRLNDNKTWNFSASGSDGYFNVNNDGYDIPGCVIFRPDGISSYNELDSFKVDIKGLNAGDVSYTVKFFSLDGIDTELTEGFVKRLYNVCLNREADDVGLINWTNALVGKVLTGTETAYGFVFSQEFKNKNYCNTDFTKQLYRAFLGREADEGGLEFWVSKMKKGAKREEIFNAFSQSDEFRQICAQYGIVCGVSVEVPVYGTVPTGPCSVDGTEDGVTLFVKRLYDVCLDRVVDEGGLDYWANALWNHNVNGISAASNFVFSEEFMGRNYDDTEYLNHLYRALMGRESDEGGIAYWSMRMKNGLSRKDVFDSFAYSEEFTEICNSYGISI